MQLPRSRTPLIGVAAAFVLNGALFGAWASRIPAVKLGFDLSPGQLGALLLLLAAGAIVSFPVTGRLSDRLGATLVTQRIGWLYGLALIGLGFAPSLPLLAIALVVFGMTHGSMDVAMNAWGAEVERDLGRTIMPMLHALFSLGAGVGAGFGALAASIDLSRGWHFALFSVVFAGACGWLAAGTAAPARSAPARSAPARSAPARTAPARSAPARSASAASREPARAPLIHLPRGALLVAGIVAFCSTVGEGGITDWSAVFLVDVIRATEVEGAIGYAVFSVAMVVARLAGGPVVARLGAVRAARASGLLAASGAALVLSATGVGLTYAGYVLLGFGLALVMPLAFSRAANDPDIPAGTAIASVAVLGYGGLLLGPVMIGSIAELSSLRAGFALILVLGLSISLGAASLRAHGGAQRVDGTIRQ